MTRQPTGRILRFWRVLAARTADAGQLPRLASFLLRSTVRLLRASSGSIMLHDPRANQLVPHLSSGHHAGGLARSMWLDRGGVAARVFATGIPVLAGPGLPVPSGVEMTRAPSASFISVPLRVSRRTIGVLNLNRAAGQPPFSLEDLEVVESVQVQMASLIERVRLLADLRSRREELAAVHELSLLLHQNIDLEPRLRRFVRALAKRLGIERCAVVRLPGMEPSIGLAARKPGRRAGRATIAGRSGGGGESRRSGVEGIDRRESPGGVGGVGAIAGNPPSAGGPAQSSSSSAAELGEPAFLAKVNFGPTVLHQIVAAIHRQVALDGGHDEGDDEGPPVLRYTEAGQSKALVCLPLPTRMGTRHALLVSGERVPDEPDRARQHHRFLALVSRQLAVAIEREEMQEQIRADKQRLAVLAERDQVFLQISQELASTLEPIGVLQRAFNQFHRLIDFATASVLLYDGLEGEYRLVIQPSRPLAEHLVQELVDDMRATFERDYPAEVPLTGATPLRTECWRPGLRSARRGRGRPIASLGRPFMYLPVVVGGKLTGMVQVTSETDQAFGRAELEIGIGFVGIFITALRNAMVYHRTEKLAFTDPLTSLYNHRYFQDTLAQEISRSRRYGPPTALLLLDIDYFKRFNDTWGHQLGDQVLKHVAGLVAASGRDKIDTTARYGGEEFVVVLPETGLAGAERFAERVRALVEGSPLDHQGEPLAVTVSIGVASTEVTTCERPGELIEAADSALYSAKKQGRNRVVAFRRPAPPTTAQQVLTQAAG